jgi:hypothetical protein
MRKILLNILPVATIVILLTAYSGKLIYYPGGAPAGYTGSPADGQECTACHDGSATTVSNWITSDVGPEGYTPGETYLVTLTVTGSGQKGFEVSPQNASGDFFGTLIPGTGTELTGSGHYITHSSASNSNPKVWTFQWVAPPENSGPVTMYGAFAIGFSNTRLSTLAIPENLTIGLSENSATDGIKVFPNPADKLLNISLDFKTEAVVKVSLINIAAGRLEKSFTESVKAGQETLQVDCSGLKNGLYFVHLVYNNSAYTTKVEICH